MGGEATLGVTRDARSSTGAQGRERGSHRAGEAPRHEVLSSGGGQEVAQARVLPG